MSSDFPAAADSLARLASVLNSHIRFPTIFATANVCYVFFIINDDSVGAPFIATEGVDAGPLCIQNIFAPEPATLLFLGLSLFSIDYHISFIQCSLLDKNVTF